MLCDTVPNKVVYFPINITSCMKFFNLNVIFVPCEKAVPLEDFWDAG